ncbi:FkbM family methyltransferase [Bacillus sp. IT-79MI2]|uniref:FkbM family methyltransferase n=1 Tax=Bacillus TaxID=1386 RepID=UPI0039DFFDD7
MEKAILNLPFDQKSFVFYGNEHDKSIFQAVKEHGYYEVHIMNHLKKIIKPNSICLDIGANIGLTSLALSYLAKDGLIYSFEPSDINFSYLMQTIKENQLKNIFPINLGVYDKNTNIEFFNNSDGGGWSFVFEEPGIAVTPNQVITCVRLDDWIPAAGITNVDFIKIDIEGSETKALQGALNTIHKWKPDLIIEFNPLSISSIGGFDPSELFELLKSLYPKIYHINHFNTAVVQVADYSHLRELIKPTIWGDLYCTFN